jgi:hypothetical protein
MNAQDKIRHDVETKVAKINADAEEEAMEKIRRERAGTHTLPATTNGIQHKRSTSRGSRSRSRKASQGSAHTSGPVSSVEEEDDEEEEEEGLFICGGEGEQDDRVVKIRDV